MKMPIESKYFCKVSEKKVCVLNVVYMLHETQIMFTLTVVLLLVFTLKIVWEQFPHSKMSCSY